MTFVPNNSDTQKFNEFKAWFDGFRLALTLETTEMELNRALNIIQEQLSQTGSNIPPSLQPTVRRAFGGDVVDTDDSWDSIAVNDTRGDYDGR